MDIILMQTKTIYKQINNTMTKATATPTLLVDMVLEIITKTNDGNDLSPSDLKITEMAINGFLNSKGIKQLRKTHQSVMNGTYNKMNQFMYGIEHITQDHHGCVYWKGVKVEHYCFTDEQAAKQAAQELARVCLILESKGIEPSIRTAVIKVEEYLSLEEIESTKK